MKKLKFITGLVLSLCLFLFLPSLSAKAGDVKVSADHIWKYVIGSSNTIELKGISNENYAAAYGSIANVTFPAAVDGYNVTSIDLSENWLSADVETITVSEGVTQLDSFNFGFNKFSRLHTVNLPASLTSIKTVFSNTSSLTTINFAPNSQLAAIYDSAFSGCSLTSFDFENLKNLRNIGQYAFSGNPLREISIGDNVTIAQGAFFKCLELNTATLGKNCSITGYAAFMNCTNLNTVVFGDGAEITGTNVLSDCSNLSTLELGNVKSIGHNLTESAKLKKLTIPKSCTKIGSNIVPKKVVLYVDKGSSAEKYAKANGYKYKYITKTSIKVGKVSSLKAAQKSKSSIRLSWKKVSGASGYEVYMKTNSGSYKKAATIKKGSTTSYLKKSLKKNKSYTFKVRAYKTADGEKVFGSYSSAKKLKIK